VSTTPPDSGEPPERKDRRGAPPGDPSKPKNHKRDGTEAQGRRGNLPFAPTEAQRQKVRTLAQTIPEHSNDSIAILMDVSRSTLEKHFRRDLDLGRAQMVSAVGAQFIQRALHGDEATNAEGKLLAPGNLEAQKFILARRAGWSAKVEHSGKGGGPLEVVDLSGMTAAALREYGRQAAIAQGLDPDETVGPPLDDE
jgi:hypothetical protein